MNWISLGLTPVVSQVHCGPYLLAKITTAGHSQLSHRLKVCSLFGLSVASRDDCITLLQDPGEATSLT
jgi:hypothetical protein